MVQQGLDDLSRLRRVDDLRGSPVAWIEQVVVDQQPFDIVRLLADLQRFQLEHAPLLRGRGAGRDR